MIDLDFGNMVFLFALILGGVLLLITVVLDDVVGGVLDGLNIDLDVGGVSLAPIALGFVAMFGIGGLFGTTIMDLGSGAAALVGVAFGTAGALLVFGIFSMLTRSQSQGAYSVHDMVGITGRVLVGIPEGRLGEIVVSFAGASLKRSATADVEIKAGQMVKVTGVAGQILIVEPAGPTDQPAQ